MVWIRTFSWRRVHNPLNPGMACPEFLLKIYGHSTNSHVHRERNNAPCYRRPLPPPKNIRLLLTNNGTLQHTSSLIWDELSNQMSSNDHPGYGTKTNLIASPYVPTIVCSRGNLLWRRTINYLLGWEGNISGKATPTASTIKVAEELAYFLSVLVIIGSINAGVN